MTVEYRQKILNWLMSIGIVLLVTALYAVILWFWTIPEQTGYGSNDLIYVAGPLAETFTIYVVLAPIFLFWHLFDFIERSVPQLGRAHHLTTYRTFISVMIVSIMMLLLMALGIWEYNSCDELDDAFFFQCIVRPSLWLMVPWLATMVLGLLLSLVKAAYAIRSVVTKAP